MTLTHRSTANDRLVLATMALAVLAVAAVGAGFVDAGIVDSIVKGIEWIAKNSRALRQVANGILQLANGLASIL